MSDDLLSISYNPDARYAFANFAKASARVAAIEHAASRLFNGKRLDCRIRSESGSRSIKVNYGLSRNGSGKITIQHPSNELQQKVAQLSHFPESDRAQWGKEKFFIIKSFSLEAMYQSLVTNQWHIPRRHVYRLNSAFQVSVMTPFVISGCPGSLFRADGEVIACSAVS